MSEATTFLVDRMKTPLGDAVVVVDEAVALRLYCWDDPPESWRQRFRHRYGDTKLVAKRDPFGHTAAIERYYDGDITAIDSIPVAFAGTVFQNQVWTALRTIAAGSMLSYGGLAQRIGK